ncbi:MAG: aldehyde dehydrogenase family protein, partial [Henriciella sp.]|nr:aldehyde dehydrogenase family protein [Henriciella sp.]
MTDAYTDLNQMFLAGKWRQGTGKTLTNKNPYTGETIFEMKAATTDDVDEACKAAKVAQTEWSALPPSARSARMSALADTLEARREEVMDWITREIGGTQVKAALEVQLVLGVLREAAVLPFMVEGRILPEDIPGKESRSYRQPVGVVALISPWNFPLQLTARTLAPALAVGNAVVL